MRGKFLLPLVLAASSTTLLHAQQPTAVDWGTISGGATGSLIGSLNNVSITGSMINVDSTTATILTNAFLTSSPYTCQPMSAVDLVSMGWGRTGQPGTSHVTLFMSTPVLDPIFYYNGVKNRYWDFGGTDSTNQADGSAAAGSLACGQNVMAYGTTGYAMQSTACANNALGVIKLFGRYSRIRINRTLKCTPAIDNTGWTMALRYDYGDAPTSYGVVAHNIAASPVLSLGSSVNFEKSSPVTPGASAEGDTAADNGVATLTIVPNVGTLTQVLPDYSLPVTFTNNSGATAYLAAWMDWNNNGTFETSEGLADSAISGSIFSKTFTWTAPTLSGANGTSGTYARIRISNAPLTTAMPTGTVTTGEVEDYFVPFAAVLPLTLTGLQAQKVGTAAEIRWQNAHEEGLEAYEVERSADGREFSSIGRVPVAGKEGYAFTDAAPAAGVNHYRLRLVHASGATAFSEVRTLRFDGRVHSLSLFPNPARTAVSVGGLEAGAVVEVFGAEGRRVVARTAEGASCTVSVEGLPAGLYLVRVTQGGTLVGTKALVKE